MQQKYFITLLKHVSSNDLIEVWSILVKIEDCSFKNGLMMDSCSRTNLFLPVFSGSCSKEPLISFRGISEILKKTDRIS